MNQLINFFILSFLFIYSISYSATLLKTNPPNLCVAIRGNGEALFAHWSSLSQIVEHYGPIDIMSGGSSAAITSFLYESVSKNPLISCSDNKLSCIKQKSYEISLLLKSFQGYFDYWITTPEVSAINILLTKSPKVIEKLKFWKKDTEEKTEPGFFESLTLLNQANVLIKQANVLLESTDLVNIINPQLINFLKSSAKNLNDAHIYHFDDFKLKLNILKFRIKETKDSITLVLAGGFDAKNDGRLFFRPGLVSFEDVTLKFGRMADFYSGYFYDRSILIKRTAQEEEYYTGLKNFIQTCSTLAVGKSWTQLAYTNYQRNELSNCGNLFRNVISNYREMLIQDEQLGIIRKHRINDQIGEYNPGKTIGVFPITSVLNSEESQRFKQLNTDYYKTFDKDFGINYSVPFNSIYFGYWGNKDHISFAKDNIQKGIYADDFKSQKMFALGQTKWKNVLSTSGAEPGLSPIKSIPERNDGLVSAGGWADLHPTILLKSLNCQNTVYITRINGETVFGQGVVKRLMNLDLPSWDKIDPKGGEATRKNNNNGNKTDINSTWSNLYNIANPKSSISRSIKAADAVWCTDWDTFDIKNGYTPLIDHGFNSKFYINQSSTSKKFFTKSFADLSPFNDPGKMLNLKSHTFEKGWPSYSGCVPLAE